MRRFSAARSFSDCASILLSFVTPSTSRATSLPNSLSISSGVATRVLDRVVKDCGGNRLVVELQVGEDARDLDRVAEIGVAGGALLVSVRLHGEDVGAVDQPLVRIGIVGAHLLDEFVLTQHPSKMGRGGMFVQARKGRGAPEGGRGGPGERLIAGGERLGRLRLR